MVALAESAGAAARLRNTVPGFLRARVECAPDAVAYRSREANGSWSAMSWKAVESVVAATARALKADGLAPGERVGIIAPNTAHWECLHLATLAARGVVVGLDPHDLDARVGALIDGAGITTLIAGDARLLAKVDAARQRRMRRIVLLDDAASRTSRNAVAWHALRNAVTGDDRWDDSRPDDVATIIHTSGTTGAPKAIPHTHRRLRVAVEALLDVFADIGEESRLVSWLPMSGLFQRMVNLCACARGATTWFVDDPREIMARVAEIQPHIFIGVPRFYEKLDRGIAERIDAAPAGQRRLARWGIATGARIARARRGGGPRGTLKTIRHRAAEALVLRRIREVMGGSIRYMISGSAPMPLWLLDRFEAIGLPILEAYGVSEDTVPVAANRPGRARHGSVGQPMPGNDVRIGEEGEIEVRGAGLFDGYLGQDRAASGIGPDGYYRTGDTGRFDDDGYLYLSGRRADAFKLSTGRWIEPAEVEAAYRRIDYIDQFVVVGRHRASPAALIVVDAKGGSPIARARIAADLAAAGSTLAHHQRIARFEVLPGPLTIDNDELTSSLKLRRAVIEARYADVIDRLYRDAP
jgi:long-chain acyl-CoA synthetase